MSRVIENTAFPSAMEVKLRRIRWRQVGLALLRAVAIAGSVLIASMLVAMVVDWWFTLFDTGIRAALTVTSLSLAAAAFLMVGVQPVIRALGWTRAANEADAEVPQLEERWTTVSHFARSEHKPTSSVAQAMLRQVTSEAAALERLVEPARVVRAARLKKVLLVAAASALLLAGFLAVNWRENSVLLRRFWAPTAAITATQLESVTGDAAIPRGQSIDIVTRLSGLERDAATLLVVNDAAESVSLVLEADPDTPETFTHRVDVDESFRYRVRAGDGRTHWHSITAIDPPEISEVRLTVTAPEYVDREPFEKSLLPGRVKAIQGSRLTLEMRSEAELERFELLLSGEDEAGEASEQTLVLRDEADGWYRFETLLERDLALSPTLHSPYGLTNEDRRVCRIRVIPDKAPFARVISPTEEMSVSPDEEINIKYEAHDDHGVAKAELVVYEETEDGEQKVLSVREIPLGEQQLAKHIMGETTLDLSEFDLDEGTNISYAVRVTDNRMLKLDPSKTALRTNRGGDSGDDPEKPAGEDDDAESLAQTSESQEPTGGDSLNTAKTPATDEGSSPEEIQMAGNDSIRSGSSEPSEESTGTENRESEGEPGDRSPEATVAESGKEGLRVGDKDETAAIAKTGASDENDSGNNAEPAATAAESGKEGLNIGEPDKEESVAAAEPNAVGEPGQQELGSDAGSQPPAAVASVKGDAPLPSDDPAATDSAPAGDRVAGSESEPSPPAESEMANTDGGDTENAPAAATTAAKPSEEAENDNATPAGGSSNSLSPPDSKPQLTQNGNGPAQGDATPAAEPSDPVDNGAEQTDDQLRRQSGSIQLTESSSSNSSNRMPPADLQRDMKFEARRGQNTESNRRRLKITDRLAVATEAGESRRTDTINTRELLAKIDKQLEAAEATLVELNDQADSSRIPAESKHVDKHLDTAEQLIADLRNDSKETKYEFVGLQMLDIGRTHLTPARDRMFVLIQDPGLNPGRNILEALHHITSARELLAALTKRFEEVARERELAEALEEVAEIYQVYVENARRVLREAQKNQNPMTRKMAIVEVDEAYLERYADVLEMRRDLMAEFARILAEDPRLLGKYMDIIKRRNGNMRNRLTDLRELQEEMSLELSGWLNVDDTIRPDVWIQVAEMRLLAGKDLAKSARQLEARTLSQLPLNLEPTAGIGAQVVQRAKEVALKARQSSLTATTLMNDALENDEAKADLVRLADELVHGLSEFDAVLEQLVFEQEGDAEVSEFAAKRLAESRAIAQQAAAWVEMATHVRDESYHGLAAVEQQKLAGDTEALRIDMSGIEDDLGNLFQPEDPPTEVVNVVRELMMVMETITFNQAAATYELTNSELKPAEAQQTMADEGFARAEELFDRMRRMTVDILDEREVQNPNIADLEDPTLDAFLERLEREPDLNQLLGIPNRPRNLRVIQDWMLWQAQGGGMGGNAAQQAAANAKQRAARITQRRKQEDQERQAAVNDRVTEEEMQEFSRAEDMESEMAEMLRAIEDKLKDPGIDPKQRQELQQKAEMLAQMMQEAQGGQLDREKWEELARTDEMRGMMEALAKGEPVPDSQWNCLLSTLDTGLWQVRGRTPPEDYRKAIEQYQNQIRRRLNVESIE